VRTGRLLQHYEPHGAAVNSLYFHPSGDYLASAADDATVCLLDLKEGRVCAELTTLQNTRSLGVTISSRGDRLASASADGTVRLYSTNLTPPPPAPSPLTASA
jgi:WD40 repeat protein